ncbi:MAG: M81 family metallopeptidase, partial [Clostridia bacterium]
MKIAAGMFYHEANSFNPFLLQREDLVYCEGREVLNRLYATEVFQAAGIELVPLIYAVALPNGVMAKSTYDFFSGRILEILSRNRDVDGVFLHLHGSTEVEAVGSGEYDLLKRIRALLGDKVYIGVAMDFHANNDPRLAELINVERNYRTVPHTDQDVTEKTVAKKLLACIQAGERTQPQLVRLPYVIHAEKALMATYPLNEMFEKL